MITRWVKVMKGIAALCCLGILPASVSAGDQAGPVQEIRVTSAAIHDGPSHVLVTGTWNARPACATIGWWAFDTDTSHGKALLATLLTAKATGKNVMLWGSGTCALRPDMERLLQVAIQP
jgi:hypothetical protein